MRSSKPSSRRVATGPLRSGYLSPLQSVVLLIVFLALLVPAIAFRMFESEVPRVSEIHAVPGGGFAVMLGDRIFRYDRDGLEVAEIDLSTWGKSSLSGDFLFTAADTLVFAGIAAGTDDERGRLLRCREQPLACEPLGDIHLDPGDSYFFAYDADLGRLFVSESRRHRIRVFSGDGATIDTLDGRDLFYPNGIRFESGTLYVANTEAEQVLIYSVAEQGFDRLPRRLGTAWKNNGSHESAKPLAVAPIGDQIWIAGAPWVDEDFSVHRFSRSGRYLDTLSIDSGSDIVSMTRLGDRMLLADAGHNRLLEVDMDGVVRVISNGVALQQALSSLARQRAGYGWAADLSTTLFAAALLVGFGIALRAQVRRSRALTVEQRPEERIITPASAGIEWVDSDPGLRRGVRLLRVSMVAVLLVAALPAILMGVAGLGVFWALLGALLAILLLVDGQLRHLCRQRIGRIGDVLVLVAGNGRYAAGAGDRVLYTSRMLSIDDVCVTIQTNRALFDLEQMVEKVYPLLKHGQQVRDVDMLWPTLRTRPVFWSLLTLLFIGALAFGLNWV